MAHAVHARALIAIAVASAAFAVRPAAAEDAYQVAVTGVLGGRSVASYAPVVDGLRLYFDTVSAAGGVNGKRIDLLIEDDLALPWKAAANARKLLTENKALLMLNASLSMTYAPVIAEAKSAGVPLMFAGSVCPKAVYPRADEDEFCTTALAATYDSRAALAFVEEAADRTGQDRSCRHGHSALAHGNRFCRGRGAAPGDDGRRLKQYYRVYHWDGVWIAPAKDWLAYELKQVQTDCGGG